ncbi:MAG: trimethylamine methyltransferase family protein [Alphaproteobacteria bacterium]
MAEVSGAGRRGRGGGRQGRRIAQAEQAATAVPVGLRSLTNPLPPVEPLDTEALNRIIAAAFRLLREAGIEFQNARARDILKRHGARLDEASGIVRFDEALVREYVAHAPSSFRLHARNAMHEITIGGASINFAPVAGPPNVSDLDRGRRPGAFEDQCNLIRLDQALGVTHIAGASPVEALDLPAETRHLDFYRSQIFLTDRPWNASGIGRDRVLDAIEMVAIARGIDRNQLLGEPSLLSVINVNSPRRVDSALLEGLMAMSEHGQPCVVTPFTLAGAMSPITLAGALAQQTAEALAVITLIQMIRPGCPVIFGGFTSNVDMKTGAPAFGTPEYVKAALIGGQIVRALGLPYRSSNVNASNAVDAQAMQESSLSIWAAIMGHANLIYHSTGWLEGGLTASFEKAVLDADLIRAWSAILEPLQVTDETLALDAIMETPPGGHFFGAAHTLARFKTAFHEPLTADWRNFESWQMDGAKSATERANTLWKKLLDDFEPPPVDADMRAAIDDYVARRKAQIG